MGASVYVSIEAKIFKYKIDSFKISNQVALSHSVSQLISNNVNKLLAFCFTEEVLFVLNRELEIVKSLEIKVRYSDLRNDLSLSFCVENSSFLYVSTKGVATWIDSDQFIETPLVLEPVEGERS